MNGIERLCHGMERTLYGRALEFARLVQCMKFLPMSKYEMGKKIK